MAKITGLALALLMGISTLAMAQGGATAPAPNASARTSEASKGFSIDQPGVKRTGDPIPDVDVSVKRPGSELTPAAATNRGKPTKEQREADLKAMGGQIDSSGNRATAAQGAKSTTASTNRGKPSKEQREADLKELSKQE